MLETYPAGGAKNFIHGIDYQKLWLMLFFRRAVNRKYFFRLATEMSSAAGFDDIVFRYEQNGTTVCMLIQVKHKQDGSKKICVGDLLTKSGELNLVKHFAAFLEIQGNEEFKDKIKDFFIVINVDFDYESLASKGITVEKIETQDEFLNIGDSAKYKLRDLRNNIAQYLKQRMSAEDREVSGEEIKGFLNELVFVVNLPSDVELEKLIRNEINDDLARRFKYFGDSASVLNALSTMISNWMKDKRGRFLTPEEGKEFFQKGELWASTVSEIKQGVERIEGKVDEIGEVLNNQQARKEPIWFNMMEPVASFTGRNSELEALHDALQKSTGKQAVISQVASISGLGGVGKSELARKYAYKHEKDYDGNVIWIDAETQGGIEKTFKELVIEEINKRLPKNSQIPLTIEEERQKEREIICIVEDVYRDFRDVSSLFIFDNAEGYKDIKKFLPSSLHPRHKKPYVLITSRDRKWNVKGEGDIEVIQLDEFGEVEALEFVKKALNIENNLQDKGIEELTRELQYFPLALGQAVVYIQDQNEESRLRGDQRFEISDYLKEYHRDAGELLKKGVYASKDRYTKTVLTTWNITMTYICKKYGFGALNILEIMAYLAPDDIRIIEIFSKSIADDEEKLWNAVELLNRYSMINLMEGIVNIHRLVQEVTRLKLQEKSREEETLRKALELISSGGVETSHIISIWEYASKHGRLIDDFYFNSSCIYREVLFRERTPLHLLAKGDNYEAVETLLTHIEERHIGRLSKVVNAKDEYGYTPLHLAAYSGKLDTVKYLISKGADVNTKNKCGVTTLHIAANYGKLNVVKYLVNKGANVNANAVELLLSGTSLHCAVYSEKLNIVKYLVDKGACVDIKDRHDRTPLHYSALYGSYNVAEYLIQTGANINVEDKNGDTPLHLAAMMGKVDVAKVLLEYNADVNAKNNEGKMALYYAIEHNYQEFANLLLAHGAVPVSTEILHLIYSSRP